MNDNTKKNDTNKIQKHFTKLASKMILRTYVDWRIFKNY